MRVKIDGSDGISVPNKAAKDIVVVQRPVHNSKVRVSLAGAQNCLVVMRKANQVDSVIFVIVSVYFLSSL